MPVTRSQSENTRTTTEDTTTATEASSVRRGPPGEATPAQNPVIQEAPQPPATPVPEPVVHASTLRPTSTPASPPTEDKRPRHPWTKPPSQRSRQSQRLRAELEIKERLANIELKELQVAAKLERTRLAILQAQSSSDEEIEEDPQMTKERVDMWFQRQQVHAALPPEDERLTLPPRPSARPVYEEMNPRPSARPVYEEMNPRPSARPVYEERNPRPSARPAHEETNIKSVDLTALASAIAEAARSASKQPPKYLVELPMYTGRADEWLTFKATYTQTQDSFTTAENVVRLRRSLRGAALDAVSALLITETSPDVIIQALERRFGRPEALVMAEMEKIKYLPRVTDNPRDLCIFANKMANIVAAVEVLKKPHYLHSPEMLRLAVEKLSPILRNKWYDYAATKTSSRPELKKLAKFLNYEADKCAAYALPEAEHDKPTPRRKIERTYVTDARPNKVTYTAETKQYKNTHVADARPKRSTCQACQEEHQLPECPQFLKANTNTRWEVAKKHRVCFRCLRSTHRRVTCGAKLCGQDGCTMRHHKLLHVEKRSEQENASAPPPQVHAEVLTSAYTSEDPRTHRRAYLKVAPVTLIGPKGSRDTYALLDEGSTVSIIEAQLARDVGLEGPVEAITVQGVNGDETKHINSKRVSAMIKGKYEHDVHHLRDARTVEKMNFFTQSVRTRDIEGCHHIEEIREKLTYEEAAPKVLIGQDNWELIISRSVRDGPRDHPVASLTRLGWVLHGCRTSLVHPVAFCAHLNTNDKKRDPLEELMKKHFELESLGIQARKQGSDPEVRALEILNKKSRRLPDGRFETGLLWRNEDENIPNNFESTMKRLKSLEKKLDRDNNLKKQYEERINNLMKSGYAERATAPPTGGRTWYLPHFAVINPEKEKIRLVHDAAAKSHGRSLNDMLLPGPDLLQSLPGVIMKFRQYPIAVSSDIKEMFMQVKIIEEDRDALRFLWRGDNRGDSPPDEYRMTSLIFGATSSPCTALYVKDRNATENAQEHPAAARAIRNNHYMDDYLHSFATVQEAQQITAAVDRLHKKAGFELRGWAANDQRAIQQFQNPGGTGNTATTTSAPGGTGNTATTTSAPGGTGNKSTTTSDQGKTRCTTSTTTKEIGGNEIEKTLGLLWHVKEDTLCFRMNKRRVPADVLSGHRKPTKREALSLIMSIFDPLGLISPITTPAKRIMQDTWKYKTDWDEPIPSALTARWRIWLSSIQELSRLKIPRCYDYNPTCEREIHTFVDASEEAYAAAVYVRGKRADGSIQISLVAAKSRVTPTKPISIPRLELQAALMGARLTKSVEEGHDFEFKNKTYWSDSRTALSWIRAEPRTYKTFVAHRLAEIEDLTKKEEWRWVPTDMNVADDSTRDTPSDFTPQHRWFTGPRFLYEDENTWPTETIQRVSETGEEREKCYVTQTTCPAPLIEFARFSKWTRLLRATGRVLQFVALCRPRALIAATRHKRTKKNADADNTWKKVTKKISEEKKVPLTPRVTKTFRILDAAYLHEAERLLIKYSQAESCIAQEYDKRTSNGPLTSLSVTKDENGIIRLRGRVNEAESIDYDSANPVILDGRHHFTKLYIQHVHETLHHGGVETVVNELRQRLWIVRIRPIVKEIIKSCPRCRLRKAKPASPSTGDLPASRLAHHTRPFTHTGLDYFGPLEVTVSRHREKRYVALFTCMTSRAIHLEPVTSLSTDSAINAIRRFIARRGCPAEIWSDNATCFKSANRELIEAWKAMEEEASVRRISWRFLPPAAPFMAGVWERMVRTVKEALRVTLHEQRPSDETLNTLLAEAEATVNSRPLTHVAVTPEAPPALTPNMILLGPNSNIPPPGKFEESDVSARTHWRRAQRLADVFWHRWVREYLPLLQHRREPHARGTSPAVGDLVIICDPNLPRNTWPRGKVTAVFPGRDGEVRVVDVTTSNGRVMRRPTKRVVVLPVE